MYTQHGRQRIRRPAHAAAGVVLGNRSFELLPRQQHLQLLQKQLTASLALFDGVLGFGKGQLAHVISGGWWELAELCQSMGVFQRFPSKPVRLFTLYLGWPPLLLL